MLNLPLALIGGVLAVWLSDSPAPLGNLLALVGLSASPFVAPVLSIASLVGFVTLFGIAVRNGILLVNHYDHLMRIEGVAPSEALVEGSVQRLVPILMTALTAALGLLPLALTRGASGSELLAPLAVVVLGGLLSSTFLNLVVVPVAYAVAHRIPTPTSPPSGEGD
jgi:Cu/Ag efflux pump CusA